MSIEDLFRLTGSITLRTASGEPKTLYYRVLTAAEDEQRSNMAAARHHGGCDA